MVVGWIVENRELEFLAYQEMVDVRGEAKVFEMAGE
jgi:hypothetical protein